MIVSYPIRIHSVHSSASSEMWQRLYLSSFSSELRTLADSWGLDPRFLMETSWARSARFCNVLQVVRYTSGVCCTCRIDAACRVCLRHLRIRRSYSKRSYRIHEGSERFWMLRDFTSDSSLPRMALLPRHARCWWRHFLKRCFCHDHWSHWSYVYYNGM